MLEVKGIKNSVETTEVQNDSHILIMHKNGRDTYIEVIQRGYSPKRIGVAWVTNMNGMSKIIDTCITLNNTDIKTSKEIYTIIKDMLEIE